MEISIDLKMLSSIVYGNDGLLQEMIEEWLVDTEEKINKLKEKTSVNFKEIHFLKTSFSMIGCVEGIKICEKLIQKQDTMDIQSLCHIFELSKEVLSQNN